MPTLLAKLAAATKNAKPYWRWFLAALLFVLVLLAAYVIWRKLERLRQLENEHAVLKEKLKHDQIKSKLVTNAEERKKLQGQIEALEKKEESITKKIEIEKETSKALQDSIAKAKSWKDLEA